MSFVYDLDTMTYDKILELRFVSKSTTEYQCYIACKKLKMKQICVFDIQDDKPDKVKFFLNFFNETTQNTMVCISFDYKQIVFANGSENFLLKSSDKDILI